MANKIVYNLAVRIDGKEYIAINNLNGNGSPVIFPNLEMAKSYFSDAYKVLSDGPINNPISFAQMMQRMALFQPVFLKIPMEKLSKILLKAMVKGRMKTTKEITLSDDPLGYIRVNKEIIEKYLALDVLKDIESTPTIRPDGQIIYQQFNIHNMDEEPKEMRPRDPTEILKQLGLL